MAEKDRNVTENMKRNGELEMLMNEIPNPNAPYLNHSNRHHHHQFGNGSPISRVSLRSGSSSSSSFSNGFCSSEDGSPYPISFEEAKHQTPSTRYSSINGKPGDGMGLSETFHRMHISDEQRDGTNMRGFEVDSDGFGFGHPYLGATIPWNAEKYGEGFSNGAFDFEGFQSSRLGVPASFNDNRRLNLLGLRGGYRESDSMGSYLAHHPFNALCSGPNSNTNHMNVLPEKRNERGTGSGCYYGGVQRQNLTTVWPYLNDASISTPWCETDSNGVGGLMEPLSSPRSIHHPKLALNVDDSLSSRSMINERTRAIPNNVVPQSVSLRGARDVEAFTCEDSFIIKGNTMNYAINSKPNASRSLKKNCYNEMAGTNHRGKNSEWDSYYNFGKICENGPRPSSDCPLFLQRPFSSLAEIQGYIYFLAKDQHGCRFLQRLFDKGTCQDVQIIFKEIIGHLVEFMTDPFGNYLVQKLLDVCNEEQRMQTVLMATNQPGQLIRISIDPHGTRVVQKLIETVRAKKQISLVNSALEPGFLALVKDPNGNHVIQRCLQCFSNDDNKFIFVAATKFCVDMATHRHGCCVLQRCIARSVAEHRDKLAGEVSRNGILLAQDPYGNYVVQYIIELKIPSASAKLFSQFKGNFVQLSKQKFSSHVVEKCLTHFEEHRPRIIRELLSESHFDQLLQDRFANYVIQCALAVTKGPLHASLVEEVEAHKILSTSPYCKRIFSRKLLKK
ncbi:hypothetical protein I3843_07G177200 [Carya illinoinensis]|uniref:PUM-HD domain-containing protein n=1 Tax=Carya illinoinensis TaxID=32201 RepID=A0A8T1Q4B4_CARIL|nr:putative pumilio homolog 8, chloroplastic [Carya illinoinensis]KAG2699128.1 hypothetical protein I3760_07G177900 [Carya illinoinensis]KAG6648973.1 hypothetical protein CIPAW_07G180700 [Carya illinoinensis]KAG7972330.1 hypothetical protein I3843_07G177200 [Carya illinoinensis]